MATGLLRNSSFGIMNRPAEWSAAAAAIALIISRACGVQNADTITAIAIVIGFIPTGVTSTIGYIKSLKAKKLP